MQKTTAYQQTLFPDLTAEFPSTRLVLKLIARSGTKPLGTDPFLNGFVSLLEKRIGPSLTTVR